MFKNYLKGIEGIADYPVISLVAFFLFFVAMMLWWFRADKNHLDRLSGIPFDESPAGTFTGQTKNQPL